MEINMELLKYVPNGDKQMAVRVASKYVTKSAITATSGIIGANTGNPILISTAASFATSLLDDLSKTEYIGNCLRESGVNEDYIKKCIEDAKKRKQQC